MDREEVVIGRPYGRLVPRREATIRKMEYVFCDCVKDGVVHKREVRVLRGNLVSGNSESCGCKRNEAASNSGDPARDRAFIKAQRAQGYSFAQIAAMMKQVLGVEISRARVHKIWQDMHAAAS